MSTTPVLTYVPGSGATQMAGAFAELFGDKPFLHYFNEETAYTVAHGASLVGRPAVALLKSHGLAKAMNSVIASLVSGSGAPFVAIVFEDPTGKSSDHVFCAKGMLKAIHAFVLEAGPQNLLEQLSSAIALSERYRTPIFITVDAEAGIAATQAADFQEKARAIQWPVSHAVGKAQALLNPFLSQWNERRFKDRCENFSQKAAFSFHEPHPQLLCPDHLPPFLRSTAESYVPWIRKLGELGFDWVTGDAGTSSLFGLPPFSLIDVCTFMGGSISLAMGAQLGGKQKVLAVTGDFSFLSTGSIVLAESVRRESGVRVVVLCNRVASATGNQEVQLEWVKKSIPPGVEVEEIRENDLDRLEPFFSSGSASISKVALLIV